MLEPIHPIVSGLVTLTRGENKYGRKIYQGYDSLWTKIGNGFIAVVGGVKQGIAKIRAFMLDVLAFIGEQLDGLVDGVVIMVNGLIRALNKIPKIDID